MFNISTIFANINFEQADAIIKNINEVTESFNTAISYINNAKSNVPPEIQSTINSKFDTVCTNINSLKETCNGIYESFNSAVARYKAEENMDEDSPSEISAGLTTEQGTLKKLDANYFTNLAQNGVGEINVENNTYIISNGTHTYQYNYSSGKLTILNKSTNKKSSIPVGIYVPDNASDLSGYNTTTFLGGDGERRDESKYCLSSVKEVKDILAQQSSSVLIVPQARASINGSNNPNGFIPHAEEVTQCTKFTTLIMNQNDNCENNIVGISSGGFSALDIAASEGNDTYDSVYVFNGRMKTEGISSNTDYTTLKDKDIFMFVSQDGVNHPERVRENIQYMHDNGFTNITIASSERSIINMATNLNDGNINIVTLDNNTYKGHPAMWKAVVNSDVLCGNNGIEAAKALQI